MFMFHSGSWKDVETAVGSEVKEPARQPAFQDTSVTGNTVSLKPLVHFPERFMAYLRRNQGRPLKIILMVLVFISALYTKTYTGDFQLIINNHIGGIFYVLFGSLLFSVLFQVRNLFLPVIIATSLTCILEFVQWFRFPFMVELTRIKTFAYLFGNSFNPKDFIYYGIGSLLALLVLWIIREN